MGYNKAKVGCFKISRIFYMNWKKAIGFGVLLWIIMFVVVSVLVGFDVYKYLWVQVVAAIIAGVVSLVLAGYVKPHKAGLALGYGLTWVIVGIILDLIITTRFDPTVFSSWILWLGYALVLLAPLLKVRKV